MDDFEIVHILLSKILERMNLMSNRKIRVQKMNPILLTRRNAIDRLSKLMNTLLSDSVGNETDEKLREALDYLNNELTLLKCSCIEKVYVHSFNAFQKYRESKAIHIYLPLHHEIWTKFVNL